MPKKFIKKWNELLNARYYIAGIVLSLFLLPVSSTTLGDATQIGNPSFKNPATDCRLAPNPDQCYRDQQNPQTTSSDPTSLIPTSFSTNTLGMEGPFQGEVKYDTDLSWIFGLKYLQLLGESVAIGTQLTAGPREMRANFTTGYELTKNQRVKLTYEYLTQNLPYDFASGSIREWVKQHSVGAAYEYVFQHEILHSLELSGYATRAQSKELSHVAFNQQMIVPGQDYIYDVNYRRIAGGKENTGLASLNLYPFADNKTTLTLGAGYSTVKYDTIYETDSSYNSNQGIAYKAELNHILNPKLKLNATVNSTAASREHSVQLNKILPGKIEAAVKGQYTKGQAGLQDNKSVVLSLSYPAPASYETARFTNSAQELKEWVAKPVVYSNRVLAIKDEMVVQYQFAKGATIPDQTKYFHDYLDPVATVNYFYFDEPSIQVNYTVYIQRLTVNGTPVSNSNGKDYTKDLNLGLVSDGPNQVVLKSASNDGIPEKDSTGETTLGDYQVTITANGSVNGLAPMVVSNSFKLTVQGGDISWKDKTVPDAYMGYTYLDDPTKTPISEVDLNQKITLGAGGRDTAATITLQDGKPFPSAWLKLDSCQANPDHQCLMTNGTELPNNADIKDFNVSVVATGNVTKASVNADLNAKVMTQLPEWASNPTAEVQEGQTAAIPLPPYILKGLKGLKLGKGDGFDPTCWSIPEGKNTLSFIGSSEQHCLEQMNVKVPLTAINDTSYPVPPVPGILSINIKSFAVKWVSPETTKLGVDPKEEDTDVTYNLNTQARGEQGALVQTTDPNGQPKPDDIYTFTLVSPPTGWTVENGTTLRYHGDALVTGDIKITLSAVSNIASPNRAATDGNAGGGLQNTYTIHVQTPIPGKISWKDSSIPDAYMGYKYLDDPTKAVSTEVDLTSKIGVDKPYYKPPFFEFVDDKSKHPDWLKIGNCPSGNGHQCLVSSGAEVPNKEDLKNFTITLKATANSDVPDLPSISANVDMTAAVKTQLPEWILNPTAEVQEGQTTAIPLPGYIAKGLKGLAFKEGNDFDPNCWTLDVPNSQLFFKSTTTQCLSEINPKVPLKAGNLTSYPDTPSVPGTLAINIKLFNVQWTATPPQQLGRNPITGMNSVTYYLNTKDRKAPDEAGALVQTTAPDGSARPDDIYTFKLISAPPGWSVDATGNVLHYESETGLQPGDIKITLSAQSNLNIHKPNAIGGNSGGGLQNTYTLTVKDPPSGIISWKAGSIPDASMGYPYLNTDKTEVDLTSKISVTDPSYGLPTFEIIGNQSPDWLKIQTCSIGNGHWCLVSTKYVPNDVDIHNFDVKLKATSNLQVSSNLRDSKIRNVPSVSAEAEFTPNVITQIPVWEKKAAVNRDENDTTPIDLKSYISAGYYGLDFPGFGAAADNFNPDCWELIGSGEGKQLALKKDRSPSTVCTGLQAVPVFANNLTSFGEKAGVVLVNVTPSPKDVSWISNNPAENTPLPNPKVGVAYNYPLQLKSKAADSLVKTTAPSAPQTPLDDSYDFELAPQSTPGWTLQNGSLTHSADIKTGDTAVIILKAKSATAEKGKSAIGGNIGDPGTENQYTLRVEAPAPVISWKAFDLPPTYIGYPYLTKEGPTEVDLTAQVELLGSETGIKSIQVGKHPDWVSLDLQKCKANPEHLCLVGNATKVPRSEPLGKFSVDLIATGEKSPTPALITVTGDVVAVPPKWLENPTPLILERTDPTTIDLNPYITEGKVGLSFSENGFDKDCWKVDGTTLTFTSGASCTVQDQESVPLKAENDTSVDQEPGTVPVVFSNYNVRWTANTLLPNPNVGDTIATYDLASTDQTKVLVKTTDLKDNPQADTYTFKLEAVTGSDSSKWSINNGSLNYQGSALENGQKIQITLSSVSNVISKGQPARNGNVPGDETKNQYTLIVSSSAEKPKWNITGTPEMRFDFTGEGSGNPGDKMNDLGTVKEGINLNKMISNSANFDSLAFTWDTTSHPLWQIKEVDGQAYLLRDRTNDVNQTVDAADVAKSNLSLPAIKVCGKKGAVIECVSNSAIPVKVTSDPALVYDANQSTGEIGLTMATSNGQGGVPGRKDVRQTPVDFSLTAEPAVLTPTSNVIVSNDTTWGYHSCSSESGKHLYLDYTDLVDGKIALNTPTKDEFDTLIITPDKTYVCAHSMANGGYTQQAAQNVRNLKPVTGDKVILVPELRDGHIKNLTSSSTGYKTGIDNIGVGLDNTSDIDCATEDAESRLTVTALAFALPEPSAGKSYYLKQLKFNRLGSQQVTLASVCKGLKVPNQIIPPAVCPRSNVRSVNNADALVYTYSGTGSICGGQAGAPVIMNTNFDNGAYRIGNTGGDYTLFIDSHQNEGRNMPTSYFGMSGLGTDGAPTFGMNESRGTPNYSTYPVVELRR